MNGRAGTSDPVSASTIAESLDELTSCTGHEGPFLAPRIRVLGALGSHERIHGVPFTTSPGLEVVVVLAEQGGRTHRCVKSGALKVHGRTARLARGHSQWEPSSGMFEVNLRLVRWRDPYWPRSC